MQLIQWWYWEHNKILENYNYFTEDVESFCDRFYDEAIQQFEKLSLKKNVKDDAYLVYVDYYENYCSYPTIIEEFLDAFLFDDSKRLILFVQNDVVGTGMDALMINKLKKLIDDITESPEIKCRLEMIVGDKEKAVSYLLESSHFITTRTFNTVYTTCLADQSGTEIISGIDENIVFNNNGYNMVREAQ